CERGVVLLGAEERAERIVVPEVKTHLRARPALPGRLVNVAVDRMLRIGPEFFPGEQLGVVEQQAPECDEAAVGRTRSVAQRAHILVQRGVARLRAGDVDAAFARGPLVMLAEAGDPARVPGADLGAERVEQRAL